MAPKYPINRVVFCGGFWPSFKVDNIPIHCIMCT